MNLVQEIEKDLVKKDNIPEFTTGDTIKVSLKVIEGGKERLQAFEGTVISKKNSGLKESFTVRRISFGVGVERTFFTHSPRVSKIEVLKRGKVRRAKLYYLRALRGKKAKIKQRTTKKADK